MDNQTTTQIEETDVLRVEVTTPHAILGDFGGMVYKAEIKKKIYPDKKFHRKINAFCKKNEDFGAVYKENYKQAHAIPLALVELFLKHNRFRAAYVTVPDANKITYLSENA